MAEETALGSLIRRLGSGATNFLNQMLPYMTQQGMQRDMIDYQAKTWLEKTLKEYGAYGELQTKQQQQAMMNSLFGDLSDAIKGGVKGSPFPGMEYITRADKYGLDLGDVTAPPEEERTGMMEDYQAAALPLIMARLSGQQPSDEDVQDALRVFGFEAVEALVGEFAGDVLKRAEQGLRGGELEVSRALIPVRTMEAETSRKKMEIEGVGERTPKELRTEITKLQNDRDTQVQKWTGVGSPLGTFSADQQRSIAAKVSKIDMRIREIEQITGKQVLPGPEEHEMFKKMATENVAANKDIDWQQAMIMGFDIYWILNLAKELGVSLR